MSHISEPASPPAHLSVGAAAMVLMGLAVLVAGALVAVGPLPQVPAYHDFADQRTLAGIPNAMDVLSNLPFLLVGGLGLTLVLASMPEAPGPRFRHRWELLGWGAVFASMTAVAFGSSYYHLAPDNHRLVWDRVPITLAFTVLFALVLAERLGDRVGRVVLVPFALLGVASVFTWYRGEMAGVGDLRPYVFVQLFPLLTIPLLLWKRPPVYSRGRDLLIALVLYGAAKVTEALDGSILELTGQVSGHTLKHLLAGVGVWLIFRMVARREILRPVDAP